MDKKRKPHPSDELLEALLDATFDGDEERFEELNERYSQALGDGVEVGKRGKKVKLVFGSSSGGKMVPFTEQVVCPDCDQLLECSGVRFESDDDDDPDPYDGSMLLEYHRYDKEARGSCPAYRMRRWVYHLMTCLLIRKLFHIGCGWAWRNLHWERTLERYLYRFLKWKMDLMWKMAWAFRRVVGWIEQPLWNRKKRKISQTTLDTET